MIQFKTWKSSTSMPEWDWWDNTYTFSNSSTSEEMNIVKSHQLLDFEGGLSRNDTDFHIVAWRTGIVSPDSYEGNSFGMVLPFGHGNAYRRGMVGLPQWRYVLGMRKDLVVGRHSQNYYRNCITEEDCKRSPSGRLILKDWKSFDEWIELKMLEQGPTLWAFEVGLKTPPGISLGAIPIPSRRRYGAFAADMHAQTRWRRRLSGNGKQLFAKLRTVLCLALEETLRNQEMINYDIAFVPADYFDRTVAILGAGKTLYDDLKDFFDDADLDENNGTAPPATRFGVTSATIMKPWQEWQKFAKDELEELLKKYKPEPNIDGRMYISSMSLQIYDDALQAVLKDTASIFFFDWYNPKAYEKNSENWMSSSVPDVIELAF